VESSIQRVSFRESSTRPRVLFMGMPCLFSTVILQALMQSGVDICALVVPAYALPGRESPPLVQRAKSRGNLALSMMSISADTVFFNLAHDNAIPIWDVYNLKAPQTVETLAAYQPDFICVACFSRRIPSTILSIPRMASLNVHPSLLPRHRGPVPLFWTLRDGEHTAGVTIHLMEEQLDTGAIVLQESLPLEDGKRYAALEEQCAHLGASLLPTAIEGLLAQTIVPQAQDEKQATYESYPGTEDYMLVAEHSSAHHIYNFVRGVASRETPVEISVAGYSIFAIDTTSYSFSTKQDEMKTPEAYEVDIACKDGIVRVISL
jgi:methionyl-tRNA formyltransferase